MTTTPTAAPAVTTIDHLDFDAICHVRNRRIRCEQTADWWVIARAHCRPDATVQGFWCDEHYAQVMAGTMYRCTRCGEPHQVMSLIIRTERIR
jgi:hypothetical protein